MFLLTFLVQFFFSYELKAQTYFYFGDAHLGGSASTTDQYGSVFATARKSRKTQHVYTAQQLQATGMPAGLIQGIAFYCTSLPGGSGYTFNNVNVKFGQTNVGGSSAGYAYNVSNFIGNGLSTVYTGNLTVNSTGWVQIAFNQPFMWDGVSNLQVQVCSANSNSSGSNGGMAYEVGFQQTRGRHSSSYTTSWCSQTYSYNNAYLADIRFEFLAYNNDASLLSINSPLAGGCTIDTNLNLTIENTGLDTLNSVDVEWEINGVAQPTVSLTGLSILPNDDSTLTVAQSLFQDGDSLKIWTAMPNGVQDSLAGSDTLSIQVYNSLNGLYSIDQTGSGDFLSFSEAANALMARGACGEVVFEAENGLYIEQIDLTPFPISGDSSKVTFRSASGNSQDVILQHTAGTGGNFVWNLNNIKDVHFEDLTLQRTGLSTNSAVVVFQNEVKKVTFKDVRIEADSSLYGSTNASLVFFNSGNSVYDSIFFENSDFINGSRAVHFNTNANQQSYNLVFDSCNFIGQSLSCIDVAHFENLSFTHNQIVAGNQNTSISGYGVALRYGKGDVKVIGNYINGKYPFRWGIYTQNFTTNIDIVNNKIVLGDTAAQAQNYYGIYEANGQSSNIFNNSVLLTNDANGSYSYYATGNYPRTLLNNIFENRGNGSIISANSANLDTYNYNSVTTSNIQPINFNGQAYLYNSFKNMGYQANDLSVALPFSNDSTLQVCNDTLNDSGWPIASVNTDIQGVNRLSTPDLGAQEFFATEDFVIDDQVLCADDTVTFDYNGMDSVIWNGTINSTHFEISTAGVYSITADYECGMINDTFNVVNQTMSALENTSSICDLGQSTILAPSVPNANYQWSTGATTSSVQIGALGLYQVTITDSNGCTEVDSTEVKLAPKVSLADTFVCDGSSVTLNAAISGTYEWSTGSNSQVILVDSEGTYQVTVTDNNNCVSSDAATVELISQPTASFNHDRNYFLVNFQSTSIDGTSYHWDFGDSTTSTLENPVHVYPTTQNDHFYDATLTVYNQCDSTKITIPVFVSGDQISSINDQEKWGVSVYPNPVRDVITIAMNDYLGVKDAEVYLLNIQGVVVKQTQISLQETTQVDVSSLPNGLYQLQVVSDYLIHSQGVVVAK